MQSHNEEKRELKTRKSNKGWGGLRKCAPQKSEENAKSKHQGLELLADPFIGRFSNS